VTERITYESRHTAAQVTPSQRWQLGTKTDYPTLQMALPTLLSLELPWILAPSLAISSFDELMVGVFWVQVRSMEPHMYEQRMT